MYNSSPLGPGNRKSAVRSDQIRRKSLSSVPPKLSPKASANVAAGSDYDDYGVGGGEGALLESYYFDDDSPVYFQKTAVDQMRKPRGSISIAHHSHHTVSDVAHNPMNRPAGIAESPMMDEKLTRLRYILEKKEYREVTWKYFHSFMMWKDAVFKDRPDIFHTISVDYIRVLKAVNASISDTTMMKVWNKELHTALDIIFEKLCLLKQRLTPPDDELKREGFSRLYEHTAISRKLDRLAPLALQVMLAVNHRILWQIFCLYCDDKRAIPDPTINKAHPILRLHSTEDGEDGIGRRPMNHAHPWYSKRIVSEDALWQLLMDTRICPSQFGRRQMEKYLRDIAEEAHQEAEKQRLAAEAALRSPSSSPTSRADKMEDADDHFRFRPFHQRHAHDQAGNMSKPRSRSYSNQTDSADENSATSPSSADNQGFPSIAPLANKPSFKENPKNDTKNDTVDAVHKKASSVTQNVTSRTSTPSRIPVRSKSTAPTTPNHPQANALSVSISSPTSPPSHAPVLGSRSMPSVHPSKALVSFSTFVKLLWKVTADCIRMPLTADLVAAIRKIIKHKSKLRGLVSLVSRGQWPKLLKALHETGSTRVPTGPR